MLLGGSNNRGVRGQTPNRSRGSRGRGSTSRGAPTSSSSGYLGGNFKPNYSDFKNTGANSTPNPSNPFEQERLENAAKRLQRGHKSGVVNGRGGRGAPQDSFTSKQVRFSETPQNIGLSSRSPSPHASNPFANTNTTTTTSFGHSSPAPFNPFATALKTDAPVNPFGASNSASNTFSASSQRSPLSTTLNVFGAPSQTSQPLTASNVFGAPSSSTGVFGAPSDANPFGAPPPAKTKGKVGGFLAIDSNPVRYDSNSNPFGALVAKTNGNRSDIPGNNPKTTLSNSSPFGAPSKGPFSDSSFTWNASTSISPSPAGPSGLNSTQNVTFSKPMTNGVGLNQKQPQSKHPPIPTTTSNSSSSALSKKIDQLLRKQGIISPSWPTANPGDPKQKDAIKTFWQTTLKGYRSKVRTSLIKARYLDDPDKPKKLSEAIDFKGTCEDMCPEFEKFTRIVDHSVDSREKEIAPDGSKWPSMTKMVKALARSAAGQDAPLPMDVRTPAALRRTLNYLLHMVLGDDGDLPTVHGFLWDRTRAIRRDFVFQSAMNSSELSDQIYCLERITRFHVIALHQMSREDIVAEDFSEQQEVEQLGKSLLSLIHAYEDCNAQGIECENEAEFRSYYVLFNSHNSGILETVQDWGWKFWGESDDIRTAVSLVEALQNIWDTRGPLKPHAAADIAQNGYSKFFTIVEDRKVSYTMACFAEIHFNNVRKSILKTILTSYRKQRDQTKDWTLAKLNAYMRFDDEGDIVSFGEAYGVGFDDVGGEECLSFFSEDVSDPFPPLKQRHSYDLVERKRGDHPLPAAIDKTVYELGDLEDQQEEELFVKDNSATSTPWQQRAPESGQENKYEKFARQQITAEPNRTTPSLKFPRPFSMLEQSNIPKTSGPDSFTETPSGPASVKTGLPSIFTQQPVDESPPTSAQTPPQPPSPAARTPFSVSQQPSAKLAVIASQPPLFLWKHPVNLAPAETPKAAFSLGGYDVTKPPSATVEDKPIQREISSIPPLGQAQLPNPVSAIPLTPALSPKPVITSTLQPTIGEPKDITAQPICGPSTGNQNPAFSSTQSPTPVDRKKKLAGVANWVALGNDGILDQFTAFHVEKILRKTVRIFMREESKRIAKEADESARKEADLFRYRSLATKYGHMWREAAHRIWLRRRGREARKARREMAESFRASKSALSANFVEDFRTSTGHRRESLESLLRVTGALNGVKNSNEEIEAIVQPPKRQRSERSIDSPVSKTTKHKRGQSDNPLRRSLLSDPSYLDGGSRIHFMSNYGTKEESRRQFSGVQTDYFRLKARGIVTLPDGTPLANAAAKNPSHQQRSFDGITKLVTPIQSKPQTAARGALAKPASRPGRPRASTERDADIESLKMRAKVVMSEDRRSPRKRSIEVNDEELFERAKRIREQMDEGTKFYRKEIERDALSRSGS